MNWNSIVSGLKSFGSTAGMTLKNYTPEILVGVGAVGATASFMKCSSGWVLTPSGQRIFRISIRAWLRRFLMNGPSWPPFPMPLKPSTTSSSMQGSTDPCRWRKTARMNWYPAMLFSGKDSILTNGSLPGTGRWSSIMKTCSSSIPILTELSISRG